MVGFEVSCQIIVGFGFYFMFCISMDRSALSVLAMCYWLTPVNRGLEWNSMFLLNENWGCDHHLLLTDNWEGENRQEWKALHGCEEF
jgi:hypothetical protein